MQIWKFFIQAACADAELGHLTSVSSPVVANKYHRSLVFCVLPGQESSREISASFPCLFSTHSTVSSRCVPQGAFLGQISSGTLPPPQKIFSKFPHALDTTMCSHSSLFVLCVGGWGSGISAHTGVLRSFSSLIPPSEDLPLKEHLVWDRVSSPTAWSPALQFPRDDNGNFQIYGGLRPQGL